MDRMKLLQSAFGLLVSRSGSIAINELQTGSSKGSRLVTQLISLRGLQHQQTAAYSAYKKPPSDGDDNPVQDDAQAGRKGHLPRISTSAILHSFSPERVEEELHEGSPLTAQKEERRSRIQALLKTNKSPATPGAAAFMSEFFGATPSPQAVAPATPSLAAVTSSDSGTEEGAVALNTPDALDEEEEEELLAELKGLRKGSQRIVLQKLLQGGMLRADPEAMAEWEELQKAFRPPENFRMKVVDVNRTCKGTRSGGLYRFSCMVVVGNGEGVLGWGQGKAMEVNSAVKKAYMRACRNLYPIPRFNEHTIPERTEASFGKVKVVMYPKAAGNGIVASTLVTEICKMAGIHDIGVKIHGSRNPRNTVKCLFEGFDKMRTHEEILSGKLDQGKLYVAGSPGKFARMMTIPGA